MGHSCHRQHPSPNRDRGPWAVGRDRDRDRDRGRGGGAPDGSRDYRWEGRVVARFLEAVGRWPRVTVHLWRTRIEGYLRWTHARQLIRVERTVEKQGEISRGVRYFVTNLVPGRLLAKHWLTLVRMYWRCENEGHWTADVIWKEDARRTPWIRAPRAVYALASLRMLALNILAVLRRMSRREWESRPIPWREATRLVYFALANPTRSTRTRLSCD